MIARPRLEGISDRFADKPLIGFVSTMIKDYTPLIDEYYYCERLLHLYSDVRLLGGRRF